MHEAHAVVERGPAVHLPVVLNVALGVVVEVFALDVARQLVVGREAAEHRVREPELRVDRVAGVVREVERPERRRAVLVLRLVAVIVVEPGLQRVTPRDPGHARGEVLGRIDVEEARVGHVGRRVGDAVAPGHAGRRDPELTVDPERRLHVLEDLVGVVARVELQRIRKDHRQTAEARGIAVGDVVARDAGRAEDRAGAGLAEDAPAEGVLALPVGRLEERRGAHVVVHRHRQRADDRVLLLGVVEAGQRAVEHLVALNEARILRRGAQLLGWLVVDANRRLLRERLLGGPGELVVVGQAGAVDVRQRIEIQQVDAGLIEAVGGNPAEHAAVVEAAGLAGRRARARQQRVLDVRKERAVVVVGLREIAGPFECRRHAVADDVVAAGARRVLVAVEEEQLVVAARLADRAADRIPEILFAQHRLGIAVEDVGPAVGVPVRVPEHAVDRATEPVGAALGHGRDLQAARASVFGLVARGEDLHFRDRLDVHLQQDPVVAGIHRRDAVHHDVVLAAAADPARVGAEETPGASDARLAKPRLAIGRFSTDASGMVNERSPLEACTICVSA